MTWKSLIISFNTAWEMLLDFPLPRFLQPMSRKLEPVVEMPDIVTQIMFPIIGAIFGLLLYWFGLLLLLLPGELAGGIIFTLVLTLISELKDSGRGLGALVAFIEGKSHGVSSESALATLKPDIKNASGALSSLTLVLAILFKLLCFYLMFHYGYIYWVFAVMVLEFTAQGYLAASPPVGADRPLLEIAEPAKFYIWAAAAFFMCFIMFQATVVALIAFGATLVFALLFKSICERKIGGVDVGIISFAGYCCQLGTLLLGLLVL